MTFQTDQTQAGLALALGVQEVRPVDLVTAYGTLANGGRAIGHTTILNIQDRNGKDVVPPYVPPAGTQVVSPQAAFIVTDILAGNTNPSDQPVLGQVRGPGSGRPPAGDAQDRHQQRRQGPQRLRLHRAADRRRPHGRCLRPRRRRLERQLGQQPGVHRPVAALLDRRVDLRLAGLPPGGQREVAGRGLRGAGRRPGPGQDRSVDRPPRHVGRPVGQRVVHRRDGAQGPASPGVCGDARRRPRSATRPGSPTGWRPTRTGCAAPRSVPGPRVVRTGPGRATSTTGGSSRTARRGARCSAARAARRRARRRAASRCRRRTPSGVIPSFEIPTPDDSGVPGGSCPARWPSRARRRPRPRRPRGTPARREEPSPSPEPTPTPSPRRRPRPRRRRRPPARPPTPRRSPRDRPDQRDRRRARRAGPAGRAGDPRPARLAVGPGERWVVIGAERVGQDDPAVDRRPRRCGRPPGPSTSSARATAQVDSREIRRRIGAAGSAVERRLARRPDAGRPGDDGPARRHRAVVARLRRRGPGAGPRAARPARARSGRRSRRSGRCRRASDGASRSPGRSCPTRTCCSSTSRRRASTWARARRSCATSSLLAAEPRPTAIVLVTHHVEEIPPGFTHALVLRDGAPVAAGPLDEVLTDDVLSRAFGLPIAVERRDGRAWARMRADTRNVTRVAMMRR